LCSPSGKLRTVEGVRSEFTLLLEMIEAVDSQAIASIIKPIRTHIDDLLVPFQQVEAIHAELLEVVPHQVLDFLVLAWHHDHFYHSSQSKQKRYHQRERDDWLALADGLLDDEFAMRQALVFEKLDSIVRASSLVEMVHSFIRPSLNSCQGQITQETLNLILFYHNHRRYKGGKRKGKAPRELLTGEPLEAEWVELLLQQVEQRQDATDDVSLASRTPLELMPHRHGHTAPSLAPQSQESLEHPADTEDPLQQPPAKAA